MPVAGVANALLNRRSIALRAAGESALGASARGLHDLTQTRQEAVVLGRLVEKGIGPGQRALHLVFRIGEVGQHEYFRLRCRFIGSDVADDGDTVAFLQPDVGDDDVRVEFLDRLDRLLLGLGKADDIESAHRLDVVDDASADKRRILDYEDAEQLIFHQEGRAHQLIRLCRSA